MARQRFTKGVGGLLRAIGPFEDFGQSRVAPVEPDALRAWLVAMAIAGALLVRRRGTNAEA